MIKIISKKKYKWMCDGIDSLIKDLKIKNIGINLQEKNLKHLNEKNKELEKENQWFKQKNQELANLIKQLEKCKPTNKKGK